MKTTTNGTTKMTASAENNELNTDKGGGSRSTNDEARKTADPAQPAMVHLVVNKLWSEQVSAEETRVLITNAKRGMRDGYRLAFPLLMNNGGVYQGVLLVAELDYRTQALKIDLAPGATHLAILLLFKDLAAWQAQVDKLIPLWPEQPEIPGMVLVSQQI